MTAEDIEQQIRRHPTANERFLLGLLDEARGKVVAVLSIKPGWNDYGDGVLLLTSVHKALGISVAEES